MSNNDRLSLGESVIWSALGLTAGVVAGAALSQWIGGVNRPRIRRAASRIQQPEAVGRMPLPTAARAAAAALLADARLKGLGLEAIPVSRGAVELRGWVDDRAARARAARAVRALPGIDTVINSILVRGEDDRLSAPGQPTDLLA